MLVTLAYGVTLWISALIFFSQYWFWYNPQQWRIQDSLEGGAPTAMVGRQPIMFANFPQKLYKIEEIWTERGVGVPGAPLRSANDQTIFIFLNDHLVHRVRMAVAVSWTTNNGKHKYVGQKGLAAMLVIERPTGVAQEVNCEIIMHSGNKACKHANSRLTQKIKWLNEILPSIVNLHKTTKWKMT